MGEVQSRSIHIATSPEDLWTLLTTTAGVADWYDTWDTVEAHSDQHLQQHTVFRLIRERGGRRHHVRCQVTVLDPPHRLAWIEDQPPYPETLVEFHLQPDPAGHTLLTMTKTF